VKAGLTTLPKINEGVQLTELLNSLESAVAILESKSYTVSDTLVIAIERARAAHSTFITEEAGTNAELD
jgi:hypothetical protein